MKKILNLILSIFLCMFLSCGIVYASEIDENRQGSITVTLDDIDTDFRNVSLSLYKVTSFDLEDGFQAISAYSKLGIDFNDLEDASSHKAAVKLVLEENKSKNIRAVASGITDEFGVYTFDSLNQGMYLVVQNNQFDTYGTIDPFLVSIPLMEDDIVIYDVKTETKAQKPGEKEPPKEPEDDTDTSTQTNIGLYMMILLGSLVLLLILRKRSNKK